MNAIIAEIKRLNKAARYSLQGFRHAWDGEAAFRIEIVLAAILTSIAIVLNFSALERVALIGTVVIVLIIELLNSAVEAAVDRIGKEHHPLSGRAKDLGSAAVLVSVLFCAFTWVSIFWSHFTRH